MGLLLRSVSSVRAASLFTALLCLASLAVGTADARIWDVPVEAPTIAAGIDSAAYGDTVLVACGTYYESDIVMKSGVRLVSATGGPDCATIDPYHAGRVFICSGLDSSTSIEGFTLMNGSTGVNGGGVYCYDSYLTFDRCRFVGNQAVGGGAIRCDEASPTIVECVFEYNSASGNGGAISLYESSPTIDDCEFVGNLASSTGGAISSYSGSSPEILNSTFDSNEAMDGGALYSYFSDVSVGSCLLFGNEAFANGGAVRTIGSTPTFAGCTVARNTAPSDSGGGFAFHSSTPILTNTIIAFNEQGGAVKCQAGSYPDLACCDVYGNVDGDWTGCIAGELASEANFSADPLFFDLADHDYRLTACSPCFSDPTCSQVGALSIARYPVTIRVPDEEDTIDDAIAAAAPCDTVLVECGIYENVYGITLKNGVRLISETGEAGCAELDALGAGRVLYCSGVDSSTIVRGFTIYGGYDIEKGGAMLCEDSSPILENVDFASNSTGTDGAGGGFAAYRSSPILRGCGFWMNSASDGIGGAVYLSECSGKFRGCAFLSNNVMDEGGGVACVSETDTEFEDCMFYSNSSGWGAGLYARDASPTVRSCLFASNDADHGGGICAADTSVLSIENTTLVGNEALSEGGGVACLGGSNVSLEACIVANSWDGEGIYCDGTSYANLACCDVYGNVGGDWVGCIAGQQGMDGNIQADPLFCGGEGIPEEYELESSSPCAGDPTCGRIGAYGVGCQSEVYWTGWGDGSSWGDSLNWDVLRVPGPGDHVIIDKDSTFTVHLTGDAEIYRLWHGYGAGGQTLDIHSGTLSTSGASFNSATIVVRDSAALRHDGGAPDGIFDNFGEAILRLDDGDLIGDGRFENWGLVEKLGSGSSWIAISFGNMEEEGRRRSQVTSVAGSTYVSNEMDNMGDMDVGSGAVGLTVEHYVRDGWRTGSLLNGDAGRLTVHAGGEFRAVGTTVVNEGTIADSGTIGIDFGGRLTSAGTTTVYEGGVLTNEGQISVGDEGSFVNRGSCTMLALSTADIDGTFLNEPGSGLYLNAAAGSLSVTGNGVLTNRGELRKVGSGHATLAVPLENYAEGGGRSGSRADGFFVEEGSLRLDAPVENDGRLSVLGTASARFTADTEFGSFVNGGTLAVDDTSNFRVASGSELVNWGDATIDEHAWIENDGYFDHRENALLSGDGLFDTSEGVAALKGGISPGSSVGSLSLAGNIVQSGTSEIVIEIGGTEPGTGHDQIILSGTATLDGAVDVSLVGGFEPSLGDSFEYFIAGGGGRRAEGFNCYSGLDVPGDLYLEPVDRPSKEMFLTTQIGSGNTPPVAVGDSAAATAGVPVAIQVLANDTDVDGDDLRVVSVETGGTSGAVAVSPGDLSVTYTAPAGLSGADSFFYNVTDCEGGTDQGEVVLSVTRPPRVWHVPEDAPTIQAGIDSAAVGDSVVVAPGTYGPGPLRESFPIVLKSGVALIGEGGAEATIVNASGVDRVFSSIGAGGSTLVRGFTISGGVAGGVLREDNWGGGISCEDSSLRVEQCVFSENMASVGGGLACSGVSAPVVEECAFVANVAWTEGGGVACGSEGHLELTSCTFFENEGSSGSGLHVQTDASISVSRSIIAFGRSSEAVTCDGGEVWLECCDVFGNEGGDWAGCIAPQAGESGNLEVDPAFCDSLSGDLHLDEGSPCADAPGCGRLGAFAAGCVAEPQIEVGPNALAFVWPDGPVSDTLFVSNDGRGALLWQITEQDTVPLRRRVAGRDVRAAWGIGDRVDILPRVEHVDLPKGVIDVRRGDAAIRGSGGPDAFGYRWTDSDEAGGPEFQWIDVSSVGTALVLGDDDHEQVALPFLFPFYGEAHESVLVSSNGYLTFGDEGDDYGNDPIADPAAPNALVAPFWDDLNPELGGAIHYHHDTLRGLFVVQYTDVPDYWTTEPRTFQVRLDAMGGIVFAYLDMGADPTGATVGIENGEGTDGLDIAFNAAYVGDDLEVSIVDAYPWVAEVRPRGELEGPGTEAVRVWVDGALLDPGRHRCDLRIESNVAGPGSEITVPVTVDVGPSQLLQIVPGELTILVGAGGAAGDTLRVTNAARFDVSWTTREIDWREDPRAKGALGGAGLGPPSRDWGGPDGFGYTWIDSDAPDGPVYDWREISGIGTEVALSDNGSTAVGLPFDFPFYGAARESVRISANGYLTFGPDGGVAENAPIPAGTAPDGFIAPFWDDLDPGAGGSVYYHHDVTADEFIVEYVAVPRAGDGGHCTFEVVLKPSGTILVQYGEVGKPTDSVTVGIENPEGTDGLEIGYNSEYPRAGVAVSIADFYSWMWEAPPDGDLIPGGGSPMLVSVDATGLEVGTHEALLLVESGTPGIADVRVPVTVTVVTTGVEGEFPGRLMLRENYPNPFNPTTRIVFGLPAASAVRLSVYDVAGRRIRGLLDGERSAGFHAVVWDGRDDDGRPVASGVYFYRLEGEKRTIERKMVLLK